MSDVMTPTGTAPGNTHIGQPIDRVEDDLLLRGQGEFVADVPAENVLHAVIFRSPVAHARVRSIGLDAALALPGVAAICTHEDIGPDIPTIPLRQQVFEEVKP